MTTPAMDQARAVADAVLYEGYLLYPYRASAAKNKVRWQWGVLMPPAYVERETGEYAWSCSSNCSPNRTTTPSCTCGCGSCSCSCGQVAGATGDRCTSATVAATEYTSWRRPSSRRSMPSSRFTDLLAADRVVPFGVPGGTEDVEAIPDAVRLVGRSGAELVGR